MSRPTLPTVQQALLALALATVAASSAAQSAPPQAPAAAPAAAPGASAPSDIAPGRQNQKIERIRIEDKGATVDELRVGGETQSITVTPHNNMPAYEVMPATGPRSQPQQNQGGSNSNTGPTTWPLKKF